MLIGIWQHIHGEISLGQIFPEMSRNRYSHRSIGNGLSCMTYKLSDLHVPEHAEHLFVRTVRAMISTVEYF